MSKATIETTHKTYGAASELWQRCRDVHSGSDAVKGRGVAYLPKLSGQTPEEYQAYKMRAAFYNGYARSVNGLTGTALAVPPTLNVPEKMATQLTDVTLAGEPIAALIASLIQDNLVVSRRGFLLDYSSKAERPYLVAYDAEQITDWDTMNIGGDTMLSYVVLKEQVRTRDNFEVTEEVQYRRLRLVADLEGGPKHAVTEIWKKDVQKNDWVLTETIFPARRGARLDFIPFVIISSDGITPAVRKPALVDLADLNLSHYRTSADLEHGRHFTGLPQPVLIGAAPTTALRIGSSEVWPLPLGGDAKYMEFTGQGLKTLETALEQKERQMAILGSRMLEGQKKAAEAAATVRMRQAGDDATLSSVVGACEQGLDILLRTWAWWAFFTQNRDDQEIGLTLNKDFVGIEIPVEQLSLLAQADKISFETLYFNLERAGLTRPEVTAKQEREQILAEGGLDPQSRHDSVKVPKVEEDDDEDGEDPPKVQASA